MTFFKTLFARQDNRPNLQPDFSVRVDKAIQVLADANAQLDNEQFIELLVDNGINKQEAIEIYLFLPIAFVRHWIADLKWLDTYIEYFSEQRQIERKFSETASYQIISTVTRNYFQNSPNQDAILKIGGRSAEFHAINQLLNDNPQANLQDIELSPTVIIR